MEAEAAALSAVSIANIGVLLALVATYARIWQKTRASMPIGMIVVASLLMLHNAVGALAYFSMDPLFSHGVFSYMIIVGIAELAGLAALLKITLD